MDGATDAPGGWPDMEQEGSVFVQTAKIVGIAGVAAGVVGAVLGRVLESQREPSAGERLQAALDDVKGAGGSSFVNQLSEAVEQARKEFERAKKKSKKQRKLVRGKKRGQEEADLASVAASGMLFADYMRRAVRNSSERFGENLQDVLEQTTESLSKNAEQSRKTSKKRGKELKRDAKKRREAAEKQASEGLEELMKFRKGAADKAEDRLEDIGKFTRAAVEKRVKPALEKAGAVTLAGASKARHRLEEESKDLEKRYADVKPKIEKRYADARPKIEKSAEHYADVAADLVKELRKTAQEQARDAGPLLQDGVEQARELAREGSEQAKERVHEAGDAAKEGSRNAVSLLVWTAIAGGLIYQVLLNEEQKRKVREFAIGAYHEGKAIYQDLRGENADFSAQ
ncbi:MAG TPA: hypothetical protein VGR22_02895 [Thermomicrobiales bacterium]|nr:hypothetical protein [Thermomicrobiales bacterium]